MNEVTKFKGKHSEVYVIDRYAIKVFKKDFLYNFKKEVKFLTLLQPFKFVPRLYFVDDLNLKIVMEYINGIRIGEFLKIMNEEEIRDIIAKCYEICYVLDSIGIQKEEMSRPDKHIIIKDDDVFFIDFERSLIRDKPANVTQFTSYVITRVSKYIDLNVESLKEFTKNYKRTRKYEDFIKIMDLIRCSRC